MTCDLISRVCPLSSTPYSCASVTCDCRSLQLLSSTPYYDEVYGEGVFNHSCVQIGAGTVPKWVRKEKKRGAGVITPQY